MSCSSSAPEILLGETSYSTAVDMWSVGCIFGELILNEPIFQAKGEMELIAMVCVDSFIQFYHLFPRTLYCLNSDEAFG